MKLSIITINYNNLAGLRKTVASVLAQTWRDFEWIIVDGGSTDGSKEYIEQLAADLTVGKDHTTSITPNPTHSTQHPSRFSPWSVERFSLPGFTAADLNTSQITHHSTPTTQNATPTIQHAKRNTHHSQRLLWCSEPDKGIYNAMNKGIQMASGEYLNFMNSGDCFYESDTLEKVFSQDYTADIVYGDWKRVWSDREDIKSFPYPIEIYSFYKENICHQAMFVSRMYHQDHLYDESYKILADCKNWKIAIAMGAAFVYCKAIVCVVSMDGISQNNLEVSRIEYRRISEESWSEPVRLTLEHLDAQLKEPYQLRLRTLLEKRGLARLITLSFLRIMKIVFLRDLDESCK